MSYAESRRKWAKAKDGNTLKDPHDGHQLTAEEAIAHIRATFTQGGGLRRGSSTSEAAKPSGGIAA